jgi:hypothetical protein
MVCSVREFFQLRQSLQEIFRYERWRPADIRERSNGDAKELARSDVRECEIGQRELSYLMTGLNSASSEIL